MKIPLKIREKSGILFSELTKTQIMKYGVIYLTYILIILFSIKSLIKW